MAGRGRVLRVTHFSGFMGDNRLLSELEIDDIFIVGLLIFGLMDFVLERTRFVSWLNFTLLRQFEVFEKGVGEVPRNRIVLSHPNKLD